VALSGGVAARVRRESWTVADQDRRGVELRAEQADRFSRLDRGTKLVTGWSAKVFAGASEATWHRKRRLVSDRDDVVTVAELAELAEKLENPDQAASAARAARRAKTQTRRWCKHNGVYRLGTLTFREAPATWDEAMSYAPAFRRALQKAFPGTKLFVTVERGGKFGRLHLQIGTDRFVAKAALAELWPHGFVDIRRLGAGGLSQGEVAAMASKCASYLAKYVGKSYGEGDRGRGQHRYEVTEGCQPTCEVFEALDEDGAFVVVVASFMGELPAFIWRSELVEDFPGPAVRCGFW
jgi:hypothetical protein